MAVVSDTNIVAALGKQIRILPFVRKNLTSVAYDVTLGSVAYFKDVSHQKPFMDVTSACDGSSGWERHDAVDGVTILPGESVLIHTHEFVGTFPGSNIVPMIRGRSTIAARFGVSVSASSGWGDVGFNSRWTLLLHNTRKCPVFIPPRTRIAQVVFLRVDSNSEKSYADTSGTYISKDTVSADLDFSQLEEKWSPLMMVPAAANATEQARQI